MSYTDYLLQHSDQLEASDGVFRGHSPGTSANPDYHWGKFTQMFKRKKKA